MESWSPNHCLTYICTFLTRFLTFLSEAQTIHNQGCPWLWRLVSTFWLLYWSPGDNWFLAGDFNFDFIDLPWRGGDVLKRNAATLGEDHLSLITRKPVFGIFDYVRLKPASAATEASWRLEISDIETRGIILSEQWTTKALIRLRGCAGWSAPFLFAYGKNRFSHDKAHLSKMRIF